MNYADIKICDAANGPGVRVSLFVSGCTHHCKGCFNPETWDFNYGLQFENIEIRYIVSKLSPDYVSGLTILGGEPMDPINQKGILPLIKCIKEIYGNNKSIWIYTGYLFDKDLLNGNIGQTPECKEILSLIDVIVDGPFIEAEKDLRLSYRGSRNQRIIDVQKSLKENRIIEIRY